MGWLEIEMREEDMDKDTDEPQHVQPAEGDEDKPPPFDPDPRLVTYLEGGRKSDAQERLRKAIWKHEEER
jgi:hypothetical protein